MNRADLVEIVRLRAGIASSDTRMTSFITQMLNQEYIRVASDAALYQKVGTLSLVANSDVVDLPNDWQQTLQITRNNVPLIPVTAMGFVQLPDAYDGSMVFFHQSPERIQIRPVPTTNESQGLKILYVARPVTMNTDTDTPRVIPNEFHDLLAELVLARVYAAEEDINLMQAAQAQAESIYGRLLAHTQKRVTSKNGYKISPPPAGVERWSG